jgi:2-polyprenyl-3-methyl-5-hydroxy-6-metoxy-1,4-benzoquinol methylase
MVKIFVNKDVLNMDMLKKEFEIVKNPKESDFAIYWVDIPEGVPLNKCIYIAYEVPLTGPIYWAYANFDRFNTVYAYNPSPDKVNQFPISLDYLYYPVNPYFQIDIKRDNHILENRGVYYAGQKAGEMYKDVPDTFGLNLKLARDRLAMGLIEKYPQTHVFGPGWPKDSKTSLASSFRQKKMNEINLLNPDFHIVIENYSMPNLISERLHDGFSSDRLILYYGDPLIKEKIPENCFIDLSNYFNKEKKEFHVDSIISLMKNISKEEYMKYLESARTFRKSMDNKGFEKARNNLTQRIIDRIKAQDIIRTKKHFEPEDTEQLLETIRPNFRKLDLVEDAKKHVELLEIPKDSKKILEIGCGIGRVLNYLRKEGKTVAGIDFSEQMVNKSKLFYGDLKIEKCSGLGDIPFESKQFDTVYSIITFQHIPSIDIVKRYISESYRVLSSGKLIFQVLKDNKLEQSSILKNFHNLSELKNFMKNCGFTNITEKPIGEVWVVISGEKK